MREQLTAAEQALLEASRSFANLRTIRSTRQVEDLFRRVPLVGPVFKVLPPRQFRQYYRDQAELRFWLEQIAKLGKAARDIIGRQVAERLGTVPIRMTYDPAEHRIRAVFVLNGVQAAYSYAVALLLAADRGLTTRLGQCGWCTRFNLTVHGKPKAYCSVEHRRRDDARRARERMRQLRESRMKRRKGEGEDGTAEAGTR
ncbi:MAG: hypothetical protein ACRDF5_10380 [bacterium]